MKRNEKIDRTLSLMVDSLKEDNVVFVAYYIRPRGCKDIDEMSDKSEMGFSTTPSSHFDTVVFEKYLHDNLFNTKRL